MNNDRSGDNPRVYWALSGPFKMASSRLHGYRIHAWLQSEGWESILLYELKHRIDDLPVPSYWFESPLLFRKGDIVVFQKLVGPATLAALELLRKRGIATVYVDCDFPPKISEAKLATTTVVSSDFFAEIYRAEGISNIRVIGEAFDAIRRPRSKWESRRLTGVWFGSMDGTKQAELYLLGKFIKHKFPNITLVIVSNTRNANLAWNFSWDEIGQCDFAVVTGTDCLASFCKSPNRVVQAMALGLPVIAYPLPSYRPIIRQDRNGLMACGEQEWETALTKISDPIYRKRLAWTGYRYARRHFAIEQIGRQWTSLFKSIGCQRRPISGRFNKPKERMQLESLNIEGMQTIATSMRYNVALQKRYKPNIWRKLVMLSSRPSTRERKDNS
jgi:hypothetical protein